MNAKAHFTRPALTLLLATAALAAGGCQEDTVNTQSPNISEIANPAAENAKTTQVTADAPPRWERAVIAGGCFWCVEAVFEEIEGVREVVSGYAGGSEKTANYQIVAAGLTDHAEAVEIEYDANKVPYEKLLAIHFATHDPTTLNRQGADVGKHYRSAIFYKNEQEKAAAQAMIDRLNNSDAFGGRPIVTTLEPLEGFYKAEAYHQNYVCDNPLNPYVAHVAMPKVEKVRKLFKDDLKKEKPGDTGGDAKDGSIGKIEKTEAQWKQELTPQQYHVLREKGTERPFTNKYDKHFEPGTYSCAACGLELFESKTKFDSGCGWPAFYAAKAGDRVKLHRDLSHGMVRTEVTCARCDGHLGHVFDDAPQTPTGNRLCIHSVSLKFTPAKDSNSR